MFQADQITDFLQRDPGTSKVPELSPAINGSGIKHHMIMDMGPIRVSCYDERVLTFGKPEGKLLADFISFLRSDFTGFEGLADLVGYHIVFL